MFRYDANFFVDNIRHFIGIVAISITTKYFKTSLDFTLETSNITDLAKRLPL